jgi:hypothetical protein
LDRRLGGPQSRSGCSGEYNNSQFLPGFESPIRWTGYAGEKEIRHIEFCLENFLENVHFEDRKADGLYDIKMYLREVGCEEDWTWVEMTQDLV